MLFVSVGQAIKECVGANNCEVVFNLVPKVYAMSDIYCQLIPNDNEQDPYYQVMPRMGAFEVSVNGCVSIFSMGFLGIFFGIEQLISVTNTKWSRVRPIIGSVIP